MWALSPGFMAGMASDRHAVVATMPITASPSPECANAVPYAARGAMTDEWLAIFKLLWTERDPEYHGTYYRFSGIQFWPKPVQQPSIPIWVGGHTRRALRRSQWPPPLNGAVLGVAHPLPPGLSSPRPPCAPSAARLRVAGGVTPLLVGPAPRFGLSRSLELPAP